MENDLLVTSLNPGLVRIEDSEGWRWYGLPETPPSDLYISCTKVLDCIMADKLKSYFVNNSAKKIEKRLTETGNIGSMIHDVIHCHLVGKPYTLTPEIQAPFERYLELEDKHGIIARHSEIMVASEELGVAGTIDLVGEFEGRMSILDIKTGWYGVKAGWQMALYKYAYEEMTGERDLGIVGLQIKRDGSVGTPYVSEHLDWQLKSFVAVLEAWKGLNFYKLQKMEWKWLFQNAMTKLSNL